MNQADDLIKEFAFKQLQQQQKGGQLPWTPVVAKSFSEVGIEKLLFDPYFLGLDGTNAKIYTSIADLVISIWEERDRRIRQNAVPVEKVFLEEAIGYGKTFLAGVLLWLQWYELTCKYSPQEFYNLDPETTIALILLSQTAKKAKDVTFNKIEPRFNTHFNREYFPRDQRVKSLLKFPRNKTVVFPGTGQAASAQGFDIYTAVIDEANYIEATGGKTNFDKALERDQADLMEDEIFTRMQSRFGDNQGRVPGMLVAISQKGDENSYTTRNIRKDVEALKRGKETNVLWHSAPIWEGSKDLEHWWYYYIKDDEQREIMRKRIHDTAEGEYMGFVMDISTYETVKIKEEEVLTIFVLQTILEFSKFEDNPIDLVALSHSYTVRGSLELLWEQGKVTPNHVAACEKYILVPIILYEEAQKNPEVFLRNRANVAVDSIRPYLRNTAVLNKCVNMKLKTPFLPSLMKFADDFICEDDFYRYMHVDLSINGDAIGIAMSHIPGWQDIPVLEGTNTEPTIISRPVHHFDFIDRIKVSKKKEADYDEIFALILDLRDRGFPIRLATFDRFQSFSIVKHLKEENIVSSILSIDHTGTKVIVDFSKDEKVRRESTRGDYAAAYGALKNAVIEGRVMFPYHSIHVQTGLPYLLYEIRNLEWIGDKGKVVKKEGYSDDVVQVAAGCIYNAENNTTFTVDDLVSGTDIIPAIQMQHEMLDHDYFEYFEEAEKAEVARIDTINRSLA